MINQDTFFSQPNAYWSDSCPFFLDLLKEKCSYWTDWGFNATFPLLPAPSIFQVPHCSPNIWGFGRPCCWGSPAVCCQQLLLLPEAHRAAAEHPTSLFRKCPLCASLAACEHFLGFLYKSCYLRYLQNRTWLTPSSGRGAVISPLCSGRVTWPGTEQYLLDGSQPQFCYIEPISTPWAYVSKCPGKLSQREHYAGLHQLRI